jgi:hypothetical protein
VELFHVNLDPPEAWAILALAKQVLEARDEVGIILLPYGKDSGDLMAQFPAFYGQTSLINATGWKVLYARAEKAFGRNHNRQLDEGEWYAFSEMVRSVKKGKKLPTVSGPARSLDKSAA